MQKTSDINNNNNKKKKMFIVIFSLLSIIGIGLYIFFSNRNTNDTSSTLNYVYYDDIIYFKNINPNDSITISSIDEIGAFEVTDIYDNSIFSTSFNNASYIIKFGDINGIESGEDYYLTLNDYSYFEDEELRNYNRIMFRLERPDVCEVAYNDNVYVYDNPSSLSNDEISKWLEGDVVIKTYENGERSVYKLINKENDDDKDRLVDNGLFYGYSVDKPNIDEIFKELNIKGVYYPDYSNIDLDEVSNSFMDSIANSKFIDSLSYVVYAETGNDNEPTITIEPSISNGVFNIIFNVFFDNIKVGNSKGTINFKNIYSIEIAAKPDIKHLMDDFDIGIDVTYSNEYNIDANFTNSYDSKKLKEILEKNNDFKEAQNYLNDSFKTVIDSNEFIKIVDKSIEIPIIPQLKIFTVSITPTCIFNFDSNVNAEYKSSKEVVHTQYGVKGFLRFPYDNDNISVKPYCSIEARKEKNAEFSLFGDLESRLGLDLDTSIYLIDDNLLSVGLDCKCGIDVNAYGCYFEEINNKIDGYFDYYLSAKPFLEADWHYKIFNYKLFGTETGKTDSGNIYKSNYKPFVEKYLGDRDVYIKLEPKNKTNVLKDLLFTLDYYDVDSKESNKKTLYPCSIENESGCSYGDETIPSDSAFYYYEVNYETNKLIISYDILKYEMDLDGIILPQNEENVFSNDKNNSNDNKEMHFTRKTIKNPEDAVLKYYDCLNAGDISGATKCLDPNINKVLNTLGGVFSYITGNSWSKEMGKAISGINVQVYECYVIDKQVDNNYGLLAPLLNKVSFLSNTFSNSATVYVRYKLSINGRETEHEETYEVRKYFLKGWRIDCTSIMPYGVSSF